MSPHALFKPFELGGQTVANRIVMAPLTRSRADAAGVPTELMEIYYCQRSGAGLIITEGTVISAQGSAYPRVPGLYSPAQVNAWRRITSAIHAKGAAVYAQLWHVGRQSHSSVQPDGLPPVGPSALPVTGFSYRGVNGAIPFETPRELTRGQIRTIIHDYAKAAENAAAAGFDGVEIHAANGYLIDQFLNAGSNHRRDEYGGTVENRMRLLQEVIEATSQVIPSHRIGVRLSPSSSWMDMHDPDKEKLYSHLVRSLTGKPLAYLHLVEPAIAGSTTVRAEDDAVPTALLSRLFDGPVIVTGGHDRESANRLLQEGTANLVGFGRLFIANPDLPQRFLWDVRLHPPRTQGFYTGGPEGYTDYPSLEDESRWAELCRRINLGEVSPEALLTKWSRTPSLVLAGDGTYYLYTQLKAAQERTAVAPQSER